MVEKIDTYSFKVMVGRRERPVPLVNGIYLHSLYDPIKEADSFVRDNREKMLQKNYFLVLGLGFGYHVNRLISELKNRCADSWGVAVVEPNAKVFKECKKRGLVVEEKQFSIFQGMDVEALYAEKELVDFMRLKPIVLTHEASYNLYLEYYKAFLNYRASTRAGEIGLKVDNEKMRRCLLEHDDDIFGLKESVKEKAVLSKEEMLLGAFFAICEDVNL